MLLPLMLLLASDARLPRACRQIQHGDTTPFVRPRFLSAPLLGSQGSKGSSAPSVSQLSVRALSNKHTLNITMSPPNSFCFAAFGIPG
jgi:hypothetical protein